MLKIEGMAVYLYTKDKLLDSMIELFSKKHGINIYRDRGDVMDCYVFICDTRKAGIEAGMRLWYYQSEPNPVAFITDGELLEEVKEVQEECGCVAPLVVGDKPLDEWLMDVFQSVARDVYMDQYTL